MASWSFVLNVPSVNNLATTFIRWEQDDITGAIIDEALLASPGTVYLRRLRLAVGPSDSLVWTNTLDSGTGTLAGPQLSSVWETSEVAITLSDGTNSVTFKGPNHSDNSLQDDSEPYTWDAGTDDSSALTTFLTAYNGTDNITLTLDDGVATTPDADAPTVTIANQADIAENETASLSATVAGGTYDTLAYAWGDGSAGGSFSVQEADTVYTPPDVSVDTDITVTCTVTASGTGTNAVDGTSDTASDTESFTVTYILSLSNWTQPDNTNNLVLALIIAGDTNTTISGRSLPTFYSTPPTFASSGTLEEGELDVQGNTDITRIIWRDYNATLVIQDEPDPFDFGGLFSTGKIQNGAVTFQTRSSMINIDVSTQRASSGGNWVTFNTDSAQETFLDALSGGDRFIFAITYPIPSADAPTVTILAQDDITEDETATLSTTVTGGVYDELTYAWSDGGAGGSFSSQLSNTVYTPAAVDSDTNVIITCTVTATGTGTNALVGTSDTESDTEDFTVTDVSTLPDANAPTVTIADQADITENETASLSATVSGGTYDTLTYAWSDGSAGGSFSTQAANTVYTPPDVGSDTDITVTCTVTAIGTGTNAAIGTTDTGSDTEDFTVTAVIILPVADAPIVTILPQGTITEDQTPTLSATITGGTYDSITYAWDDGSAGGSFSSQLSNTVYTPPDVSVDTDITVTCTVTASGTGTVARSGTSDTGSDTEDFTVTAVIILPDADAPAITIATQADIDETDTAPLSTSIVGGTYDTLAYAWDDGSSGGSFSIQAADTVYTPPDVGSDTDITVTCTVTASGIGTVARNGTSDTASDTESFTVNFVPGIPNASAPNVTISSQNDITENETASLSATVTGGVYDTLTYAWADGSAGGSFSVQEANTVYTPPDVANDTQVTITCTVTATGTGTNALNGTSDTASDTEAFTVTAFIPLPDADAPAVTIANQPDINESETASLSTTITGGTYDTLTYSWTDGTAGGSFSVQQSRTVYTPPDIGVDTDITVTCTVTAIGTGTVANSGTSDTASDTETFTVSFVPAGSIDPDILIIPKFAATGEVSTPESLGIEFSKGWGVDHTFLGTKFPERRLFNQLLRWYTSLAVELREHGPILEHDMGITYRHPAVTFGSDNEAYASVQDSEGMDPTLEVNRAYWVPFVSVAQDATEDDRGIFEFATANEGMGNSESLAINPSVSHVRLDSVETDATADVNAIEGESVWESAEIDGADFDAGEVTLAHNLDAERVAVFGIMSPKVDNGPASKYTLSKDGIDITGSNASNSILNGGVVGDWQQFSPYQYVFSKLLIRNFQSHLFLSSDKILFAIGVIERESLVLYDAHIRNYQSLNPIFQLNCGFSLRAMDVNNSRLSLPNSTIPTGFLSSISDVAIQNFTTGIRYTSLTPIPSISGTESDKALIINAKNNVDSDTTLVSKQLIKASDMNFRFYVIKV